MQRLIPAALLAALALMPDNSQAAPRPAHTHQSGTAPVTAQQPDIAAHKECKHCGMDREKFARSRMLVSYADGTSVGTCSIVCMATELKGAQGKSVKSVQVSDYMTHKLINAENAAWVIGGDQPGVMAPIASWAFEQRSAAQSFIRKHGGRPAGYRDVLAQAQKR